MRENRTGTKPGCDWLSISKAVVPGVISGPAISALSENLLECRSFGPLTGFVGQNVRDGSGNLDLAKPSSDPKSLICVNHWSNTYFGRLLLSLFCQSREKSHQLCRGEGNRKGELHVGVSPGEHGTG